MRDVCALIFGRSRSAQQALLKKRRPTSVARTPFSFSVPDSSARPTFFMPRQDDGQDDESRAEIAKLAGKFATPAPTDTMPTVHSGEADSSTGMEHKEKKHKTKSTNYDQKHAQQDVKIKQVGEIEDDNPKQSQNCFP